MQQKQIVDAFRVLELTPNATLEELKQNYRRLAKEFHPDVEKNTSDDRFIQINAAYHLLLDYFKNPLKYSVYYNVSQSIDDAVNANAHKDWRNPSKLDRETRMKMARERMAQKEKAEQDSLQNAFAKINTRFFRILHRALFALGIVFITFLVLDRVLPQKQQSYSIMTVSGVTQGTNDNLVTTVATYEHAYFQVGYSFYILYQENLIDTKAPIILHQSSIFHTPQTFSFNLVNGVNETVAVDNNSNSLQNLVAVFLLLPFIFFLLPKKKYALRILSYYMSVSFAGLGFIISLEEGYFVKIINWLF